MDLGAFLTDDSFGAWADEEVDMSSIGVPSSTAAPTTGGYRPDFGDESRRERMEYPVPDAPPYKARVANLPYDASESALTRFFEDRLQAHDIIEDVKLPMDMMTGKPKGFAFVTFTEKALLQEALNLTMSEFNGRKVYVNVAAPQKQDVFDNDWRSARTGPIGRERREEVDLDWGAARSLGPKGGFGDRGSRFGDRGGDRFGERGGDRFGEAGGDRFGERRRREEPELDWGAARTAAAPAPPRERRPRPAEPELDWSSARSGQPLAPRENSRREGARKSEGEWASARSTRKKDEKEFDWKRGQTLPPREKREEKKEKEVAGPQKSSYDVLSLDDDDETLAEETAKLSVEGEGAAGAV